MATTRTQIFFAVLIFIVPLLKAQLNPVNAPWTTWSTNGLNDYEQILSTIYSDAACSDTKNWDLLPSIFTQDAIASYTANANLSYGLEAIKKVHVDGTSGLITQHLLSNFLVNIADDYQTANASYFAIATLFTNPQQTSGQYVNLAGYYNDKLVKTEDGWRINYHEYRFFGPGWFGNLSILPPGHPFASPDTYEPPDGIPPKYFKA